MVEGCADGDDMQRDKVLLRRKVTPKHVALPNGRTFLIRYERVSQKNLPSNVTIRRNRATGQRRQRRHKTQQEAGLLGSAFNLGRNLLTSGALAKAFGMRSRASTSEIGKKTNK